MSNSQLSLSIFDQEVCIQSDSTDYLELLRRTYSHFLVDRPNPKCHIPLDVSFTFEQEYQSGQPRFIINGEEKKLGDQRLLQSEYVHGLILSSIYSKVNSHYLFHAAALSFKEKGMIVTADSGFGKTTLTLALVQRGFRFLSDEISALGRKDGLIHAFPRGLHIREDTLRLLDIPFQTNKASRWFGKYLIDIEDIFPGMIAEPAKVSYIFVLKSGKESEADPSNSEEFKAIISHTNPALIQQLHKHSQITEVQVGEEEGYPCLVIQTASKMEVIPFLEDLCSLHGIIILDLIKRYDEIPDFSPAIKCERISKSQAALELLRRFLGGYKSALLNSDNCQDSTGLLFELASLLENADCYQIFIGPVKEMVDKITNLVCTEPFGRTIRTRNQ